MVPLDIISDPICPWCYIGKERLDRALEARPQHPFNLRWRPYQLNPNMPPEGMERQAYLDQKFGGRANADQVYGQIAEVAEDTGLAIDFGAIPRTPNTLDAHRLIHWAGVEGRQTLVVNQLFVRYFERQQDISDLEILCEVAETVGMDGKVVARLLESDADVDETLKREAEARKLGVTGVPTFLVAERIAVPGAQSTAKWLEVIDEILEALSPS